MKNHRRQGRFLFMLFYCFILFGSHPIARAQNEKPPRIAATISYTPFPVEVYGGVSPVDFIRSNAADFTLKATDKELATLTTLTDRKAGDGSVCPDAKMNPDLLRLVIRRGAEIKIAVDQNGVVRMGEEEYQLSPVDFVRLYAYLDRVVRSREKPQAKVRPAKK